MNGLRNVLSAVFSSPADDLTPCVTQANSFREVVSLQALFVTLKDKESPANGTSATVVRSVRCVRVRAGR